MTMFPFDVPWYWVAVVAALVAIGFLNFVLHLRALMWERDRPRPHCRHRYVDEAPVASGSSEAQS